MGGRPPHTLTTVGGDDPTTTKTEPAAAQRTTPRQANETLMRAKHKAEPSERIAVDTGVWLHGLLHGGGAEELMKMAVTGKIRLLTSEVLLEELARLVRTNLDFSENAIRELLKTVRDCAVVIPLVLSSNGEMTAEMGGEAAEGDHAHSHASAVAHAAHGAAVANGTSGHPNGALLVHGAGHWNGSSAPLDTILETARRGRATAIATIHRQDLSRLGAYHGIPIVEIA